MVTQVTQEKDRVIIQYYDHNQERTASHTFFWESIENFLRREKITLEQYKQNPKHYAYHFLLRKKILTEDLG